MTNTGMSLIGAPSGVSIETVSLLSSTSNEANTHSSKSDAKAESGVSVGTGATDEIEDEAVTITTRRRRGVWYDGRVEIILVLYEHCTVEVLFM